MKNIHFLLVFAHLTLNSCTMENQKKEIEIWKDEILETEKNFANMVESKGIPEAFLFYAAEDAVLMRNNKLVIGRNRLEEYFEKQALTTNKEVRLTWKPDYVDVSSSGDLGYTYGKYTFSYKDSVGAVKEDSGVFHTVWRKQPDGTWKFVWD